MSPLESWLLVAVVFASIIGTLTVFADYRRWSEKRDARIAQARALRARATIRQANVRRWSA